MPTATAVLVKEAKTQTPVDTSEIPADAWSDQPVSAQTATMKGKRKKRKSATTGGKKTQAKKMPNTTDRLNALEKKVQGIEDLGEKVDQMQGDIEEIKNFLKMNDGEMPDGEMPDMEDGDMDDEMADDMEEDM